MNLHISTQPNVNLLIQAEIVPLFTWTKCFLLTKQKNCKHLLCLNIVFSFTNNVTLQT